VIRYSISRVLQALVVILIVTLVVFVLQHLLPGNEARAVLGVRATPGEINAFERANGLNRPIPIQYLDYLSRLVHGNLGFSYKLNESVVTVLRDDIPNDIVLVVPAILISLLIAIPVGMYQALHRNRAFDYAATGTAFVLYSMPSFWTGLLLVGWFAIDLRWLPPEAPQNSSGISMLAHPAGLVLPVATLVLVYIAFFSRYMRSSVIDTLAQDYIRTARAKGMSERAVALHHIFHNSFLSIVTLLGLSLPAIFTVGLIAEQIFNLQGIGLAFYTAVGNKDYPLELGVVLVIGVATVIGNMLADIGYAVLDPRVRYD
jgi:peptide/nickel transport system permease protein